MGKSILNKKPVPVSERHLLPVAAMLIALIGMASCSMQYGAELAEELSEDIPDTVVYNFEHVVVQNAKPRFRLKARKGATYEKSGKIRMEDVSFTEYALDGSGAVAEGHSDTGTFYTKTESAELNGKVYFSSMKDRISVSSGYLFWDGKERTISSRLDTVTTVTEKESSLSGAGFKADAKTRSFSFIEHVNGYYESAKEQKQ